MVKKLVFSLVGFLSFCVFLTGCGLFDDVVSKDRIFEYVSQNHEILESIANDEIPSKDAEEKKFIRDRLGNQTIVKSIYKYNDNNIDFYCGGTGLVTGSTYSGFYYSADDTPFALDFPTNELVETSFGVYEWKNDTGEAITTERIMTNWFYYYMEWY